MSQASVKTFPILYKASSSGKEQQWIISVEYHKDGTADIVTTHGQVDGKQQTACVHVLAGKNIGRSNATTAHEQAKSEAEARWKKQLDKGYSQSRGGGSMDLKPMLAHKYQDKKDKVVFDDHSFVQPKLDGVRCLAHCKEDGIVLISRQSKEFSGLQHIRDALGKLMAPGETWDGELFRHGMPFQEIISLVKKEQEGSGQIQYHLYDKISDDPFAVRIQSLLKSMIDADDCLVRVGTVRIDSHEEIEQAHEHWVAAGYEGAMLRWGQEPYKSGYRSDKLLKIKAFQEEEFEIVDVVEGKGKFEGRAIFVCKTETDATFEAVPKGRDELRQKYYQQRADLIGKPLIVRFFEWTTSTPPVPRFPVAISVRDFE